MPPLVLRVRVLTPDGTVRATLSADPTETVAAVVARVHVQQHLPGMPADWRLVLNELPLPLDAEIREALAAAEPGAEFTLLRVNWSGLVPASAPRSAPPPTPPRVSQPGSRGPMKPVPPPMPAPAPQALPEMYGASRGSVEADDLDDADSDGYTDDAVRRSKAKASRKALVERRATVRYFARMNPQRTFPLLVILSAEQVAEVRKRAVAQAESQGFRVEAGSSVEVEPVLPGCDCYPPRDSIAISDGPATAAFWVVPQVLGKVEGARVVVRQNGAVLATVPLDVRVRRQTSAVLLALLGLVAPYLMMLLKAAKLDFESQQADGFPVYRAVGSWAMGVPPGWLGLALLAAGAGAYLWARPRQKDVFWDVTPKAG